MVNRTDEQLNRTDAQLKKTIKKLDDIGANLGKMGIVQDEVTDDKGRVLVIEVKNKLDRRMVDEFMDEKLPRFKTLLPE